MKRLDVISVPVLDQERSKQFYLAFGFTLLAENDMGNGTKWVQLGLEGAFTSITLVTWFKKMPPGCLQGLVIRSDDLRSDLAMLKEKGISPQGIEDTPWGSFAYLKDPDGNGISLHQKAGEDLAQFQP